MAPIPPKLGYATTASSGVYCLMVSTTCASATVGDWFSWATCDTAYTPAARCGAPCRCLLPHPFDHRRSRFKPRPVNRRAQRLLAACLSKEQRRQLITEGHFDVAIRESGARYRLRRGYHWNVLRLGDDGRPIERLCYETGAVPAEDLMLAQKLMLETDEARFREAANIDAPEPSATPG